MQTSQDNGSKSKKSKREIITLAMIFLLTPLAIYFSFFTETSVDEKLVAKQFHENHLIIQLPLELFISLPNKNEFEAIHILNQKGQMIIEKAFLWGSENVDEVEPKYKVEIPLNTLSKLSQHLNESFRAIPFQALPPKKLKKILKKRTPHEIKF